MISYFYDNYDLKPKGGLECYSKGIDPEHMLQTEN